MNNSRNRICAVDVETTGLIPKVHEIVEIAILPLTENFLVDEDIPVFHERIRCEYPGMAEAEALAVHQLDISQGKSRLEVISELMVWKRQRGIRLIEPLGHNLDFDMKFLDELLDNAGEMFSHIRRDTMRAAQAIKDAHPGSNAFSAYLEDGKYHTGTGLADIARRLGITLRNHHNAYCDALTAAACYREMMAMINNDFIKG